jgi:hypothetical protein
VSVQSEQYELERGPTATTLRRRVVLELERRAAADYDLALREQHSAAVSFERRRAEQESSSIA